MATAGVDVRQELLAEASQKPCWIPTEADVGTLLSRGAALGLKNQGIRSGFSPSSFVQQMGPIDGEIDSGLHRQWCCPVLHLCALEGGDGSQRDVEDPGEVRSVPEASKTRPRRSVLLDQGVSLVEVLLASVLF